MFENFPYSNFHDLNTDWLINKVKNVETSEANAKESEENAKASELNSKTSELSAQGFALQANNHAQYAHEQAQASAQSAEDAAETVENTNAQVALLQSRVDNIIPSGTQTEGNTELLDIRVGYNGYIYDSAGNAVRNQVENLHDDVDDIENILNIYRNVTAFKTVNNATETIISNVDLKIGDVINFSIEEPAVYNLYLYIYESDGTRYTSRSINAGESTVTLRLTDNVDNASITAYTVGNVTVSIEIIPSVIPDNVIDDINEEIENLKNNVVLYPSNTVNTIGHRGNDIDAPQNTEPAYIIARQSGIRIMENDLDKTDDDHLVMWHDGNLQRLGNMVDINGYQMYTDDSVYYWYNPVTEKLYTFVNNDYVESDVPVGSLTRCNGADYAVRTGYYYGGNACKPLMYDTLRRIDFGVYKAEKFRGTQILNFEEWVTLCKKLGSEIYIDTKLEWTTELVQQVASIVKTLGMGDKSSWLGLSTANWLTLRNVIPNARVGVLVNPSESNIESYRPYNTGRGVFFDGNADTLTKELTQLALSNDFEVECYYVGYSTSEEETVFSRINELLDYGITGITCDKYTVEDATKNLLFKY